MKTFERAVLMGIVCAAGAFAQGTTNTPLGQDWGSEVVNLTGQMVTSYGGVLLRDGYTEMGYLVALLALWEFAKWGMARFAAPHHGRFPLPLPEVVMIFLKGAILLYLLNHYMVNFPFTGFSFHSMPMAFAQHITLQIGQAQVDQMMTVIQNPSAVIVPPLNPLAIVDNLVYYTVLSTMGILSFGMFMLGGLSFVASGIFSVIGPLIIPWWMLSGHPYAWAWNWFQVMCAVASYRVFGAVIEYIMAGLWVDFFNGTMAGDYSIGNWIAHWGVVVYLTLFFLLGVFMVPIWAAQIFNGAGAFGQQAFAAISSAVSKGAALVSKAAK